MKRTPLTLAGVALTALAIGAGCGGGESSSDTGAKAVANGYLESQKNGDWAAFCSYLSEQSQEAIRVGIKQAGGSKQKPASCVAALQGATTQNKKALVQSTQGVTILSVTEAGENAIIVAKKGESQSTISMIKENGQWKIALGASS